MLSEKVADSCTQQDNGVTTESKALPGAIFCGCMRVMSNTGDSGRVSEREQVPEAVKCVATYWRTRTDLPPSEGRASSQ